MIEREYLTISERLRLVEIADRTSDHDVRKWAIDTLERASLEPSGTSKEEQEQAAAYFGEFQNPGTILFTDGLGGKHHTHQKADGTWHIEIPSDGP